MSCCCRGKTDCPLILPPCFGSNSKTVNMNVKKQQMRLQLQQQKPPQTRHNRTGFETLMDQSAERQDTSPPTPILARVGGSSWSPTEFATDDRGGYRTVRRRAEHGDGPQSPDLSARAVLVTGNGDGANATSPLSLPSPYYDRNPVVAFPFHHQHGPRSPAAVTAAAAAATVPLANVQNVAYADQDVGEPYANSTKFTYPWHHHHGHNYKPGGLDDDKENIKQEDPERLQQQLDEVLRACADYEERHRGQQQQVPVESAGNTSPGASSTTSPQQNRIKTNGSLPRDAKRPGAETSSPVTTSPTSPSSTTWPSGSASTPSPTVLSPFSPSAMSPLSLSTTSSVSPPAMSPLSPSAMSPLSPSTMLPLSSSAMSPLSPPAMSPLSLNSATGSNNDTTLSENGIVFPASSSVAATTCGSPRTRIKTLVPSSPPSASSADTSAADPQHGSSNKDHSAQSLFGDRQHNGNVKNCGSLNGVSLSKSPEELFHRQLSPVPLQSTLLSPSWQTTTSWLRSSPFTTVDVLDGGGGGATETATVTERTAEQRRKLLIELSAHKSRLVELHLRREEVDRELIIETALLRAELDAADDDTRQSENIVDGLDRAVAECRQHMDSCTVKQQEQRTAADSQLAGHRQELHELRSRLELIEDDDGLKAKIRASINKQTELLDAEQKLYEDVEFGLLEEEAGWLARREELHRDRAAAVAERRARRARAEWLRAQLDQLRSVGDDQLRALRQEINAATLSIQQGHKKLLELDAASGLKDLRYRRNPLQFPYNGHSSVATDRQPRSLQEWPWNDQQLQLKSPASTSPWDRQCMSPVSPWSSTSVGFPSSADAMAANNCDNAITSSMTTTCCSSMASGSGGEDDGCRPASDDSISRMSMSTIFDGAAGIKMRQKNKSSPSDMTKRPLTRYLPIRCEGDGTVGNQTAFDLRAHIESAGHQLDGDGSVDDKHFWINSTSCRGYLKKLSGAGGKRGRKWLKRWFVFDRRSRTLAYYQRRSEEDCTAGGGRGCNAVTEKKVVHPRASIHFQDIQEVYVDHTNTIKGHGCAFVVKTVQRTFYLSAATGQAVRVWVDVIFTGAEGYREYLKGSPNDGMATTPGSDGRRNQQTNIS